MAGHVSPRWDLLTHHYCSCRQLQESTSAGPTQVVTALGAPNGGKELPRVYNRKTRGGGPSSAADKSTTVESKVPEEEAEEVSGDDRVCADCKTTKTPLWRRGPAGPKSLCNACGIRYRKRKDGHHGFLHMANNVLTKERQKRRGLLLFDSKSGWTEETEAALMLMALSCGLSLSSPNISLSFPV